MNEYIMTNYLNQSTYNYFLVGLLGLLVGWLIAKLLVNKRWGKRYLDLESENNSFIALLDESEAQTLLFDNKVKELTSQLALKNSDNNTLVKAFSKLHTHRKTLKSQLNTSATLFKNTKRDNIELQDKNTSLVNKLAIAVKERHDFKELESLTVDLKTANTNLLHKLTNSESTTQETDAILKNLESTHHELQQEYKLLKDELKSQSVAKTETETLQKEHIDSLNAKIGDLSSERDQLILNAQKHTTDKAEIKTVKESVAQLEKEEKKLKDEIYQQKQALKKFIDLETKFQTLETENTSLIKNLDVEKQNSVNVLNQNELLQEKLVTIEKKLNEINDQKSRAAHEEIKRYKDYLLKSETHWTSKLNTLNLTLKSEQRNHLQALQRANDKTQSINSDLLAISEKFDKIKLKHEKLVKENEKNKTKQQSEVAFNHKQQAQDREISISGTSKVTPVKKASTQQHYPLEAIKGIGVVYARRFSTIKVNDVETLLAKGRTATGRKSLSARTDIDNKLISSWVGQADLLRVDGINGGYAELLDVANIRNIKELRESNAASLTRKLVKLNKGNEIAPESPKKTHVEAWITHADQLTDMVKNDTIHTTQPKVKARSNTQLDDLTRIKGVGKVNEKLLHSLGITSFDQIAKFTKQDEKEIGEKLGTFSSRIAKENWVKQATKLLNKI